MGVYRYTLRAPTKTLGGREIGQFKFAFKPFWGDDKDRVCQSLLAAGDRAAVKLRGRGCKLFVQGSWGEDQPVYYYGAAFSSFLEDIEAFAPHVGWLRKDSNGRWYLHLKSAEEMLQSFPEIGVLQTEDGVVYYHSLRQWSRKSANLNEVAQDVMACRRH